MRSLGVDHRRKGFCMSPADFHGAFFVLSIAFASADLTKKMIQSSFIEEHNIGLCLFFSPEAKVRQTIDRCFCPFFFPEASVKKTMTYALVLFTSSFGEERWADLSLWDAISDFVLDSACLPVAWMEKILRCFYRVVFLFCVRKSFSSAGSLIKG